jgi:hypothetical protein
VWRSSPPAVARSPRLGDHPRMGFNRRKMDDERRREAEKQPAAKRALSPQGGYWRTRGIVPFPGRE